MLRAATIVAALGGVLLLAGVGRAGESADEQARAMLGRALPAGVVIDFKAVPLKDALDYVRDVTAANIHVNWKALGAANVLPETAVSVHLRGVPLRKVLNTILSEAAAEKLTFCISDGTIEVTTKEMADTIVLVRVYAIEDLLADAPQNGMLGGMGMMGTMGWNNGGYSNRGGGRNGSTRGGAAGWQGNSWQGNSYPMGNFGPGMMGMQGMNMYMPGMSSWSMPGGNANRDTSEKTAQDLVEAIKATVYPTYWEDGKASIRLFKGRLIVRAPRCVHEVLAGPVE